MNLYHVTKFDTLFPFTCLSTVNDFNKNTDSFTLVVSIRIFWGVINWFERVYERVGDARRKFWIKPLKETDLGVAQAFFDP